MQNLREALSDVQHAIWAHWMKYLFSCGEFHEDGSFTLPADKVERWQEQMNTDYSDLSETEKQSDRHQADKTLAVVANSHETARQVMISVVAEEVKEYGDLIRDSGHSFVDYQNRRMKGESLKNIRKDWGF